MSKLCEGGDGLCTMEAEADGFCDDHHPGPHTTLPRNVVTNLRATVSRLERELATERAARLEGIREVRRG
jgi:hypothetical protein